MRLRVEQLRVEFAPPFGAAADARPAVPVDGVSFELGANQCVALLGESGCGKSMTALALMRLLPEGARVTAGSVRLDDTELLDLPEMRMRTLRGGRLAMVFQEPMTSLNPVMTLAAQLGEALAAHRGLRGGAARTEAARLMAAVELPAERLDAYPFQLSGGQRQRALIAMMLAGEPDVLIADEPTTALDVTVQAQILELLDGLRRERGMGLLLITHDLDVARDMADRVAVMYAGEIVEWAPRDALYAMPRHPYTQKLFAVLPRPERRGQRLDSLPGRVPPADAAFTGCRFAERCPRAWARCRSEAPALHLAAPGHYARCHLADPGVHDGRSGTVAQVASASAAGALGGSTAGLVHVQTSAARPPSPSAMLEVDQLAVHFPIRRGLLRRQVGAVRAVDGVSLAVHPGETLALVGESGCGKTTLARAVLRLIEPTGGTVRLGGETLANLRGEALRRMRARMQIVFQDPFASLNPRMRVQDIVEEGMAALLPHLDAGTRVRRTRELLDQVGLPADAGGRYPHEFSGGQRQRIAIARALAVEPALLILDEPTSALDVSVQAQILNLLAELQAARGLAYLFITHNLAVVSYLAHRVAVMRGGRIVEQGSVDTVLGAPSEAYTRELLASVPGWGAGVRPM